MNTRKAYRKVNGNWEVLHETHDTEFILKSLLDDLTYRYLAKGNIKRVLYKNNYNGTYTYTVYYTNDCKLVYTITK